MTMTTMKALLHDVWRALSPKSFDSKSQTVQYAVLPPLKTVALCFCACAWEFLRELTRPPGCSAWWSWRMWILIVPQVVLLAAFFLQFLLVLRFKRSLQRVVSVIVLLLIPFGVWAALHSAFRTSVSLCCCYQLLCPMTSPDQPEPSAKACSLFFSNCSWALTRKVAHFAATMAMLPPLITLGLSARFLNSQDRAARRHMAKFLRKFQ